MSAPVLNQLALLFVLAAVAVAAFAGHSCGAARAADIAAEADSLRAEAVTAALRAERIEARAGRRVRDLSRELEQSRDSLGALARALHAAGAVPVVHTRVTLSAGGVAETVPEQGPDSLRARFADPPLTADLACALPASCSLDWAVDVRADMVHSLVGRELVVGVVSDDPRVRLSVDELRYRLPETRQGFGWKWLGLAAIAGAVGWELVR